MKTPHESSTSEKSGLGTYLFCLILGDFGLHRFYAGKFWTGAAMLLTFGGLGLWTLYDLYQISENQFTDDKDKVIRFLDKKGLWPAIAIGATFLVGLAAGIPMIVTGMMGMVGVALPIAAIIELAVGTVWTLIGLAAGKKALQLYNAHQAALETAKAAVAKQPVAAKASTHEVVNEKLNTAKSNPTNVAADAVKQFTDVLSSEQRKAVYASVVNAVSSQFTKVVSSAAALSDSTEFEKGSAPISNVA